MLFFVLLVLSFVLSDPNDKCSTKKYPTYKQCDGKWGSDQLGTSSTNTICSAGCLMSSMAMALSGCGKSYDPGTLNTWLKNNGGYASGDLFVWSSVSKLGLNYLGKKSGNATLTNYICQDNIVVLNVHNGGHWVLATGCSDGKYYVNDPGYSTTYYSPGDVKEAGVYSKC